MLQENQGNSSPRQGTSISPSGKMRITPNTISICLFGPSGTPIRMTVPEEAPLSNLHLENHMSHTSISRPKERKDDPTNHTKSIQPSSPTGKSLNPINHSNLMNGICEREVRQDANDPMNNETSVLKTKAQDDSCDAINHSSLVETPSKQTQLMGNRKTSISEQQAENVSNLILPETPTQHHVINIHDLRRLASQGIPDSPFYPVSYSSSLRAIAWRVLLGYLPVDTSRWRTVLQKDRALYRSLIQELFLPSEDVGILLCSSSEKKSREKFQAWQMMRLENDEPPPTEIVSPSSNVKIQLSTSGGAHSLLGLDGIGGGDGVELLAIGDVNHQETLIHKRNGTKVDVTHLGNGSESIQSIYADTVDRTTTDSSIVSSSTISGSETIDLIPLHVRDQWRKSGRSLASLEGITCSSYDVGHHVNALLVVDDDGYKYSLCGKEKERLFTNSATNTYSPTSTDKWRQFFENASLLDEIRKDVDRTHPNLQFFLEPEDHLGQRRYAAIERILFVWAKLNRGVRYVQGMNEIVGTMYYVLANDPNDEWACEAEADTYFLFNTLMGDMKDVFVPDLDDAETGIQGRMTNMIDLLSLHDPQVQCHLEECGIGPAFYCIRWLTTLLSREFSLPDTIRLWDSMFASTFRDNFLRYVCVTMVILIREELLLGDFGTCLRLLQSYPPTNVDQLLESSRALWIYESQVTLACHKGGISLTQALNAIAPPPSLIMAYGLHAGEKFDQMNALKQKLESSQKAAKKVAANAAKSFFGNAKDLFGIR